MHTTHDRGIAGARVVGGARIGYLLVAWLFLACVVAQVFLAGLSVFADAEVWITHRNFAYVFGLLTLALLVLAVVGRLPRALLGCTVLLILLFVLQSVFIALRSSVPALAALHAVNALAIFWLALFLARRARSVALPPLGLRQSRAGDDALPTGPRRGTIVG